MYISNFINKKLDRWLFSHSRWKQNKKKSLSQIVLAHCDGQPLIRNFSSKESSHKFWERWFHFVMEWFLSIIGVYWTSSTVNSQHVLPIRRISMEFYHIVWFSHWNKILKIFFPNFFHLTCLSNILSHLWILPNESLYVISVCRLFWLNKRNFNWQKKEELVTVTSPDLILQMTWLFLTEKIRILWICLNEIRTSELSVIWIIYKIVVPVFIVKFIHFPNWFRLDFGQQWNQAFELIFLLC